MAGDSITGDYSFKSRFEDGPGANPEQLIAAAHAGVFSMALSGGLADAGTPVESVKTDATVTLRFVERPADDHVDRADHGRDRSRNRRRGVSGGRGGREGGLSREPGARRGARDHARGIAGLARIHRRRGRNTYRPFQTGARRSANAVAPSRASSEFGTGS